ncbi:transketolase [Mesorhizobium sp. M1403]|uniref:transketolase n=1 Tax=Mesorhizobium sp. M1403 TaxID=2957097 RepID=UPI0033367F10
MGLHLERNTSSFDRIRAEAVAAGIRARVLALSLERGGGYVSQACSSAEMFAALFCGVLKLGDSIAPFDAPKFNGVPAADNQASIKGELYLGGKGADLDRFYLSPSHYCMALYATLIEVGRLSPGSMSDFNRDGGTVEMIGAEHSPGMALTTGSFGQALSQVAGIAIGRKLRGEIGRNWLFMSDGEFDEGQVWEALLFLSHNKLDTVGVFVDVNGQQVDGNTSDVVSLGDLAGKLRSFGANVVEVDGHNIDLLFQASEQVGKGAPLVILANTSTDRGMEYLASRKPDLHYVGIKSEADTEALTRTLQQLRQIAGHRHN